MIKILTDSVASIPADVAREAGIDVVTLFVNREGCEYADSEMDLDAFYADIYDMVDNIPTSSQPSQHTLETVFEEAARAGEAGRGFAIVAEEIRRLANQVSEASRAADELAARATASVENGSALIRVTSTSMEGAVAATEGVKEMMSAIAQASTQQLEAVSQIQESMDSLSDVVQENSAASEESAVIGEELAEQARSLKHLIDRFVLEKPAGGSDGGAR